MTEKRDKRLCFFIEKGGCPGPFQITAGVVETLRDPWEPFELEFTIFPADDTIEVSIGRSRAFRTSFAITLMGFMTKEEKIRLVGSFSQAIDHNGDLLSDECEKGLSALGFFDKRWEVVFDQKSRIGEVFLLDQPLFGEHQTPEATGKPKTEISLDVLQGETEKLLALLKDRQEGFFTWNWFLSERLSTIHKLLCPLFKSGNEVGIATAHAFSKKDQALMVVIQKMIGWYQSVNRDSQDEGVFKLFELAKKILRAKDQKSLGEAIKDLETI